MKKIIISKGNLDKYNQRMDLIKSDIWDLLENYTYYKKIRGIMSTYLKNGKLSKRQTIRLYEFIENQEPIIYTNDILDCAYERAVKKLELKTMEQFLDENKKAIKKINKMAEKVEKILIKYRNKEKK